MAQWLRDHPDYELVEALVDAGVSAGSGKHRQVGALFRFIDGGRNGSIPQGSCLVVESWSRFSREVATDSLGTLLNDVWGQGLAISFCTDGVVLTRELINREDYRLHGLLGAMGQARREWEERSRRSKGAVLKREELQDQGHRPRGRTPFWIDRDGAGGLVVSPNYRPAIDRAVELAIGGLGMVLIAEQLNVEGFPAPPTFSNRNQYQPEGPRQWSQGNVSRLLRHPALVGTLERKNSGDLAGYYPPAVTPEKWNELRASIERRNSMKGAIRGKTHRAQNLFQTLLRCACCGGPVGYTPPAKRSRKNHPGYVACRHGARGVKGCTLRGYVEYDGVEAHCLTRLSEAHWEAWLAKPEDAKGLQELEQTVAGLQLQQMQQATKLKTSEDRAEEAWLEGDEERSRTVERAISRLRNALSSTEQELTSKAQDLAAARARPHAAEVAREINRRMEAFRFGINSATGPERLAFNRWLLSRQPEIRFLLHPGQQIEMLIGGRSEGVKPLAPNARMVALDDGYINPSHAIDLPDGNCIVIDDGGALSDSELQDFIYGGEERRIELRAKFKH